MPTNFKPRQDFPPLPSAKPKTSKPPEPWPPATNAALGELALCGNAEQAERRRAKKPLCGQSSAAPPRSAAAAKVRCCFVDEPQLPLFTKPVDDDGEAKSPYAKPRDSVSVNMRVNVAVLPALLLLALPPARGQPDMVELCALNPHVPQLFWSNSSFQPSTCS